MTETDAEMLERLRLKTEGWQPIETAPNETTVLLYMELTDTGERLGHDIGWLEDGDWMLVSQDNEPSIGCIVRPTHWMRLTEPPHRTDA
jgi:hypothetical protein